MKYNLHTHTVYSRHATGGVRDFVEEAEKKGFQLLGFSDHNPFPDDFLTRTPCRMFHESREPYERDVLEAKGYASIPVLLGWECDYWPGREGIVEDLWEHSDYLTFGLHFLPDSVGDVFTPFGRSINKKGNLAIYGKRFIKAMESGRFLFAAHPDVFMNSYERFDEEAKAVSKDMIAAAIDLKMPLEINCNGIGKAVDELHLSSWRYPSEEFWTLAVEMGAPAIVNTDAHHIENLTKHYQEAFDFASRLGVQLVEPILEDGGIRIPVHS